MIKIKNLINIILIILLCTMIFGLDYYLKKNNYLFYSSGSKEKAFLNATWEMSPNEVERANKTQLVPVKYAVFHLHDQVTSEYPRSIERYKLLESEERITLWGFETKVEYAFFDDRLFEYTVLLEGYDSDKIHKIIESTLTEKYGNGLKEDSKNNLHSMKWETNSERVEYWMLDKKEKEDVKIFLAGVRTSYKPMFGIISKIKHGSTFWTWAFKVINAVLPAPD